MKVFTDLKKLIEFALALILRRVAYPIYSEVSYKLPAQLLGLKTWLVVHLLNRAIPRMRRIQTE